MRNTVQMCLSIIFIDINTTVSLFVCLFLFLICEWSRRIISHSIFGCFVTRFIPWNLWLILLKFCFRFDARFKKECQVGKNAHVRQHYLFDFNQSHKTAARDIHAVHGDGSISDRMAQKRLSCVKEGEVWTRRLSTCLMRTDWLRWLKIRHETTGKLAQKTASFDIIVDHHLQSMRNVQKYGACVTDELNDIYKFHTPPSSPVHSVDIRQCLYKELGWELLPPHHILLI